MFPDNHKGVLYREISSNLLFFSFPSGPHLSECSVIQVLSAHKFICGSVIIIFADHKEEI